MPRPHFIKSFPGNETNLDWLKAEIANIIPTVRAGTGADLRYGLVTYEDYPAFYDSCGYAAPYGNPGDEAYRVNAPIGSSDAFIQTEIVAMSLGSGGDGPQSYGRVLWESAQPDSGINFRSDAFKVIVNFGDNIPHDCDLSQGLPVGCPVSGTTGLDPGRDDAVFSADDIDFQDDALAGMIAAEVKLIAIHSGSTAAFCATSSADPPDQPLA
ncbi:MAG: sigma-70 non-essential region-containing protein [Chloroflexi bacterium]|nr:sigma-70 non-essential region-containing protein [Chloroflexota bacterium]